MNSEISYLHLITGNPNLAAWSQTLLFKPQDTRSWSSSYRRWVSPFGNPWNQSFFAAPHGLSQRSTSFIASQRQGIHRTPLRHLIALIIMSTHSAECSPHNCPGVETPEHAPSMNAMHGRTLIRKTSLLRKIDPIARRSSFAKKVIYNSSVSLILR